MCLGAFPAAAGFGLHCIAIASFANHIVHQQAQVSWFQPVVVTATASLGMSGHHFGLHWGRWWLLCRLWNGNFGLFFPDDFFACLSNCTFFVVLVSLSSTFFFGTATGTFHLASLGRKETDMLMPSSSNCNFTTHLTIFAVVTLCMSFRTQACNQHSSLF